MAMEFMKRYQSCTGEDYRLTPEQMKKVNASVLFDGEFWKLIGKVREKNAVSKENGQKPDDIPISGKFISTSPAGTLGNFHATIEGKLVFTDKADPEIEEHTLQSNWKVVGTVSYFDRWDFDIQETTKGKPGTEYHAGRDQTTNTRVRLANLFLPGRPFDITSETVAFEILPGDYRFLINGDSTYTESVEYSAKGKAIIKRVREHSEEKRPTGPLGFMASARLLLGLSRIAFEPGQRNSKLCIQPRNFPTKRETISKRHGISPDDISGSDIDQPDYRSGFIRKVKVNGKVQEKIYLSAYSWQLYWDGLDPLTKGEVSEVCFNGLFIPGGKLFEVANLAN